MEDVTMRLHASTPCSAWVLIDRPLRETWRDLFDPSKKESASQNYDALRKAFVMLGDSMAHMAPESILPSNRSASYFVVSVMNEGFRFGSEVEGMLRKTGRSAGFVLIGHSTGRYNHADHGYSFFSDGSSMAGHVFIAQPDLCLLEQNRDKPMLIVDDDIVSGRTMDGVKTALRGLGIREFHEVTEPELV